MIFTGCKKDDDETTTSNATTVEQDKENITAGLKQMVTCIADIKRGNGVQAITDFVGLADGNAVDEDWAGDLITELFNKMAIGAQDQAGDYTLEEAADFQFTIATFKGIYTYNHTNKNFDFATSSSNEIVVKMPSSASKTTNNATFTFSKYEYQNFTFDGIQTPLPTAVYFTLEIDGQKTIEIDLTEVKYESYADFAYPTKVDLIIYTNPNTTTISYTKTGNTFEGTYTMSSEAGCTMELDAKLVLAHDDFDNISEEDVVLTELTLSYGVLKLEGTADLKSLLALAEPTADQVNQYSDIKVVVSDVEIGELALKTDSDGNEYVNIIYKDGTTDNVETKYMNTFADDLETELSDVTGSWE